MKFTLSWLKDHLDTQADLSELTEALTMIGLEVEHVYDRADMLRAFSVAEIIKAEPHPDADKLKLCTIKTDKGDLQVICGAPNARAGLRGIFAPVGATIPANSMVLKATKIRGIESHGMLCSAAELELSDAHDGIIDVSENYAIGTPAAQALGVDDPVIEIAITPNRPDCLGVRGIARDLAAFGLGTLKPDHMPDIKGAFDNPININITGDICTQFAGCLIRGVENKPSPDWLANRLTAIGLRPINALVDITNYISYDRARPLHVYDADRVSGAIGARLARAGECFTGLDEKDYTLTAQDCVIADEARVLGLGGIMGGDYSACETHTQNIFIESAYFNPAAIARSGRQHNIISDARYRFERGVDPQSVDMGLALAVAMVLEICGGTPSHVTHAGVYEHTPKQIEFAPARVKQLTGIALEQTHMHDILQALGFAVTAGARWQVAVPSWRPDIDGAADLVEEIIRIHGLNHVDAVALPRLHDVVRPNLTPMQKRVAKAKRVLAARGLVETVTYSFIEAAHAACFAPAQACYVLANPIASEAAHLRPSLLASLLGAIKRNEDRGFSDLAFFEIAPQFSKTYEAGQRFAISGIRYGHKAPRHWQGARGEVDLFDVKQDVLTLLAQCGVRVDNLRVDRDVPAHYHPGQAGRIFQNPRAPFGFFGAMHPTIMRHFGLAGQAVAFEIFPDAIALPKAKTSHARGALHISNLQHVKRDFAFEIDADILAADVLRAARAADKKLISDAHIFDIFSGKGVAVGKKSIAIEVDMQPHHATLTDAEIDAVSAKIIAAVEKATGGKLRGA